VDLKLVTETVGLESLQQPWNSLAAGMAYTNPSLTCEWFLAWWEAFGNAEESFEVVAVRDQERLRALAALCYGSRREWGLRWRVTGLATNKHTPAAAFLVEEPAAPAIDAILDHLGRCPSRWDIARFDHLASGEGAPLRQIVESLERRGWPYIVQPTRQAPVLDILGGWDEYLRSLSPVFRESIRRKLRKAEKLGARASIHAGPLEAGSIVERVLSVAGRGWAHRIGTAIGSSEPLRRFYLGLAERAAARGWLSCAFLEHDGADVAFEFSLDYGAARYNLKMGYDERYAWLSPGLVLRWHVLKDSFDRGLRAFHFLGSRAAHKDHWARRWQDHARVTVYQRRPLPRARWFLEGPVRQGLRSLPLLRRVKALIGERRAGAARHR